MSNGFVQLFYLLVIFLPESVLPVCNLYSTHVKDGHTVQLDKMFDVITCKAPKKGPASSVILADVFVNPMADPPKAPHKVCPHNTPLTSVSTNFLLHYRSATPMLIPNFSYHLVLSQV